MRSSRVAPTPGGRGGRRGAGPRSLVRYAVVVLAAACGEAAADRNAADPQSVEPALSADAIRESHRIQHMIDPARGGSGLAWGVDITDGALAVYHGGELPDQTSFLRIDLQAGLGAIVLTNAEDVDAEGLAAMMMDAVRGYLPAERYSLHALPREADGGG